MSRFSSTRFEYPLAATRIIARPTFSVVVTCAGRSRDLHVVRAAERVARGGT